MRATRARRSSDRLARLAPFGLAVPAAGLAGAAWVALQTVNWRDAGQRLVGACLLVAESVGLTAWDWMTAHPLTAIVLAVLAGSLLWALVRLGLSLLTGWWIGRRFSRYEPGRHAILDEALRLAPEVAPSRVRLFRAMKPSAFTTGVVRPKICLSAGLLESMTVTELQGVLRHEHAHATGRDPIRLAAVRFLADLVWFLPITRILAERFSAETELRADEQAVTAGSEALELASAIVKTARGAAFVPRVAAALAGLALVERRVRRLVGREQGDPEQIPWARALGSGVIVATFVAMLVGPAFGAVSTLPGGPPGAVARTDSLMGGAMRDCPGHHMIPLCSDSDSYRLGSRNGAGA